MKADYLLCFFGSVVNQFRNGKECVNKDFLIPPSLIEIKNPFISIEQPTFNPIKLNQNTIWFGKIHKYLKNGFRVRITLKTQNI